MKSSTLTLKYPGCITLLTGLSLLLAVTCASGSEPIVLNAKKAIQLSFQSHAGKSYQVYRSPDLKSWEKYGDLIIGTGKEIRLTRVTESDSQSIFRAETLIEAVTDLPDFKEYKNWKLVETSVGPDPALGGVHGEKQFFRLTYIYPADARLVNGQAPIGTIVVKEMRQNNNGQPGAIAGSLTVMVKRGGAFSPEGNGWEYFMTDNALSQTQLRGGSETMCFDCHNNTKNTDFLFTASALAP